MPRPWVLLGLIVFIPGALAHEGSIHHVNPYTIQVPPGEAAESPIEFEEGDLREDWLFVVNAFAEASLPVSVTLRGENSSVMNWTLLGDGSTRYLTTRIPATAPYWLRFQNPGSEAARVTFYYDASCNCAGKPIPPDVPYGLVVFQVDPLGGERLRTVIPEPRALDLRVTHALRLNATSQWPGDFRVLEESTAAVPREQANVHLFEWTAESAERHYFVVTATSTDHEYFESLPPEDAMLAVYITPYTEKVAAESPGFSWLAAVTVAGAALALRRR